MRAKIGLAFIALSTAACTTWPGSGVFRLFAADLNDDGFSDVVATSRTDSTVTIAFGQAGSFSAPQQLASGVFSPREISTGDFNRDGRLDLAIGSADDKIALLLASPSGFVHGGFLDLPSDTIHATASADFDGDGFLGSCRDRRQFRFHIPVG